MANYRALFYVVTSRYRTYGFSNFPSRLTNCITDSLSLTGILSDALPVSLSSVTIASTILLLACGSFRTSTSPVIVYCEAPELRKYIRSRY